MKRLKKGFTLAEVLITLSIIGIVAAIILPSVMTSYQYKTIGVKLAKFASSVEGSARPYVVSNNNFKENDAEAITDFVNETFIFKSFDPSTAGEGESATTVLSYPTVVSGDWSTYKPDSEDDPTATSPIAYLKDGTSIRVFMDSTEYGTFTPTQKAGTYDAGTAIDLSELIPVQKYGIPVFRLQFNPNVQGLPKTAHSNFNFTVTELGYVFPHPKDNCIIELFLNNYTTNEKVFKEGSACYYEIKS